MKLTDLNEKTGVFQDTKEMWRARIKYESHGRRRRTVLLGPYANPEEAADAYENKRKELEKMGRKIYPDFSMKKRIKRNNIRFYKTKAGKPRYYGRIDQKRQTKIFDTREEAEEELKRIKEEERRKKESLKKSHKIAYKKRRIPLEIEEIPNLKKKDDSGPSDIVIERPKRTAKTPSLRDQKALEKARAKEREEDKTREAEQADVKDKLNKEIREIQLLLKNEKNPARRRALGKKLDRLFYGEKERVYAKERLIKEYKGIQLLIKNEKDPIKLRELGKKLDKVTKKMERAKIDFRNI